MYVTVTLHQVVENKRIELLSLECKTSMLPLTPIPRQPSRDRTYNLFLKRELLFQLSYWLVRLVGFEPTLFRVSVGCLTTWLQALVNHLGFEPRTKSLKGSCSAVELMVLVEDSGVEPLTLLQATIFKIA